MALLSEGQTPPPSPDLMTAALSSLGIAYATYVDGPLCQALLMRDAIVTELHPAGHTVKKHAWLYLHLRNRHVWLLDVTGERACEEIVRKLPTIATELSREPCDEQHFLRIENVLKEAIDDCGGDTIRLCRHMPVAPTKKFCDALMNRFLVTLMQCVPRNMQRKRIVAVTRLIKKYYALYVKAIRMGRQFSDQLDRCVMATLAPYSLHDGIDLAQLRAYNYLIADEPEQSTRRVQAIIRYPWLRYVLTQARVRKWTLSKASQHQEERATDLLPAAFSPLISSVASAAMSASMSASISSPRADAVSGSIDAIRWALDHDLPIAPLIARFANVSQEVVEWVSTWEANTQCSFVQDVQMHFLELLSWLPPDQRPTTPSGWRVFEERLFVLAEIGGVFFLPADLPFWKIRPHHLLNLMWSNAVGKARLRAWIEEYLGLQFALSAVRPRVVDIVDRSHRSYREIKSFTTTLANAFDHIGCSTCSDDEAYDAVDVLDGAASTQRQRWLNKQSLVTIMTLAEQWSTQVASLERCCLTRDIAPHRSWPAVLEFPLQLGAVVIVPLDCFTAVDEERKRMRMHRMADVEELYLGNALLFSLRNGDGDRCVLIELRLHTDPLRLDCQHVDGYAYTPVEEDMYPLVRQFVDVLNQPAYQSALQQRMNFQQALWREIVDKSYAMALSRIELRIVEEALAKRTALRVQ